MPNDGIYPIQVVTQDADMAETLILMGKSSKMVQIRSDCHQNETNSRNRSYILM